MAMDRRSRRGRGRARGAASTGWVTALLAVALLVGLGVSWWSGRELARENAELRERLGSLRETLDSETEARDAARSGPMPSFAVPKKGSTPSEGEASEVEAAGDPAVRARHEHDRARAALAEGDAKTFLNACFALLDLGESGYAELRLLLNESNEEQLDALGEQVENDIRVQALLLAGILPRGEAFGKFCQFVLGSSSFDMATEASLSAAVRFKLFSADGLPPGVLDRLSRLALEERGEDVPDRARSIDWLTARVLATSGDPAAIDALEALVLRDPNRFGWVVPSDLASAKPEFAVPALARLIASAPNSHLFDRCLESLGAVPGEAANAELWSLLGTGSDSRDNTIWMALAQRPENLERCLLKLEATDTSEHERLAIFRSIEAGGDDATRELLWQYVDRGSAGEREVVLQRLVMSGDERAAELVVDRFVRGEATTLPGSWSIPESAIRARRIEFFERASDVGSPLTVRREAASALARVDPEKGVQALTAQFSSQPDQVRLQIVQLLGYQFQGEEGRAALRRISTSDDDDGIRETAKRILDGN